MSEQNSTGWPFGQAAGEGLDISAIFGTGTADPNRNPFDPTGAASAPAASVTPPPAAPVTPSPAAPVTPPPAAPVMPPPAAPVTQPPAAPVTQPPAAPVAQSPAAPIAPPPAAPVTQSPVEAEQPANPIEAAFAKQEMANAQQNLLEKKPIFCHKGAKEPIEDPTITFEELRICKAEDFVDLEEGKTVSWSMEYGGIRKEVKDPKGTTIAAMKQSIERSREFLEALKKSKDKNPDCLVRPKVIMKTKGILSPYKAHCESLEEARKSDKVICLVPSGDGKLYEVRKLEQGEFIAPAKKASEFQVVKAGFTPALPLIPMALIGQITAFFRSSCGKTRRTRHWRLSIGIRSSSGFSPMCPRRLYPQGISRRISVTALMTMIPGTSATQTFIATIRWRHFSPQRMTRMSRAPASILLWDR